MNQDQQLHLDDARQETLGMTKIPFGELRLFNQLAMLSSQNFDLPALVSQVLYQVLKFLRVSAGMLLLRNPTTGHLTHAASKGFPPEYLMRIKAAPIDEVVGPYLLQANTPLIVQDVAHDPRLDTSTFLGLIRDFPIFRSLVSIPLRHRRQLLGFLNLAHTSTQLLHPGQKEFFAILGNQIGMALQNASLYHALRRSEQRYRRIFEGSQDMIMVINPEGRVLDINLAAVTTLGFPSRAVALAIGNLKDFFPTHKDWEDLLAAIEERGSIKGIEYALVKGDGSLLHVLLSGTALRDHQNRLLSIPSARRANWSSWLPRS